jgi:ribosome-binding protein aMBF1 (putative translation factor)
MVLDDLSVCEDCYLTIHDVESVKRSLKAMADYEDQAREQYGPGYVTWGRSEGEGYFSWRRCDLCGTSKGGNRYDIQTGFVKANRYRRRLRRF